MRRRRCSSTTPLPPLPRRVGNLTGGGGVLKHTLFQAPAPPPADAVAPSTCRARSTRAARRCTARRHARLVPAGPAERADVRGLELGAAAVRGRSPICVPRRRRRGGRRPGVPPGAAVRFEVRSSAGRRRGGAAPGAADLVAGAAAGGRCGALRGRALGRRAAARRGTRKATPILTNRLAAGRLAPAARDDAADLALALWREALCCLKLDEWREAEAASRVLDRHPRPQGALPPRRRARASATSTARSPTCVPRRAGPTKKHPRRARACRAAAAEAGAG